MQNPKNRKSNYILFLEKKLASTKLSKEIQKHLLIIVDIFANLVVVVLLVLFMRTFIISPFQVYGISMCDTLNHYNGGCQDTYGDYIIINKSSYLHLPFLTVGNPVRGDIIVFHPPQDNKQFYIKRVIGMPGETIKLIDGNVYVYNKDYPNGIKLDEPYLNTENLNGTFATGGIDEFKVPEDRYFVLGDNRKHSSDSRICFKESAGSSDCNDKKNTPYIGLNNIEGKAALALWPTPRVLQTHQYQVFSVKNSSQKQ